VLRASRSRPNESGPVVRRRSPRVATIAPHWPCRRYRRALSLPHAREIGRAWPRDRAASSRPEDLLASEPPCRPRTQASLCSVPLARASSRSPTTGGPTDTLTERRSRNSAPSGWRPPSRGKSSVQSIYVPIRLRVALALFLLGCASPGREITWKVLRSAHLALSSLDLPARRPRLRHALSSLGSPPSTRAATRVCARRRPVRSRRSASR
jgi:hypothetical protein